MRRAAAILPALLLLGSLPAHADGDHAAFLATFRTLVETNTTLSSGSCTVAAQKMAAVLKAAGYPASDVRMLVPDGHPAFGALAAVLPGSDPKTKAVLFLAHLDVVEAKRSDWTRDPFKLIEQDGYFYGRGVNDDKGMAAAFVDAMVRYRREGWHPRRTIKLALTCGEETVNNWDGAKYLTEHNRDVLDAGIALNEGGFGMTDASGKPLTLEVQAGEKIYQDFTLVTTNPGGHSSRPRPDDAIKDLAHAITQIGNYRFPIRLSSVTRAYFTQMAQLAGGARGTVLAAAMRTGASSDAMEKGAALNPAWNTMMRTTCVTTMVNAGHAPNALAQHAQANVNCRILPGENADTTRAALVRAVGDAKVAVTLAAPPGPQPGAPPLTPELMHAVQDIAGKMWPGVPVVPTLQAGATDGIFLNAAGIPTYGVTASFRDPDGNGVHGLNERVRSKVLLDSRDFLYALGKKLAG